MSDEAPEATSDEAALLKAIIAQPGEDTPRLVYADWLDENDAPIQADFVRTQCRLASCSAADPDYPDLLERYAEIVARFQPAVKMTAPELPPGFTFDANVKYGCDAFRRGFLHTVSSNWNELPYYNPAGPTDEEIDRVCAGLAPLVANTTARHLALDMMTPELLARVLVAPGAAALDGLTVGTVGTDEYGSTAGDAIVRALAGAGATARLEHLGMGFSTSVAGLRALDGVKFDHLRSVDFYWLEGLARDLPAVAQAGWFRGLRHVVVRGVSQTLQESLLAALARLPLLESLTLRSNHQAPLKAFGLATGFPALARLNCGSVNFVAAHLARGKFPRLAELVAPQVWPDAFRTLLAAKWFPQLRVLDVSNGSLIDASVGALARSAAAANLRILRLGFNPLSKPGLTALADGSRFTNLTTLDVRTGSTAVRPATVANFAAELNLPHLRHLHLGGWPLGDAGARALAANPTLAGLTRLSIDRCGVGERGFAALVRSPHLQQLVELDAGNNNLKKAGALLDTSLLPRLAAVGLSGNPLTKSARETLHRARGWIA